MNILKYIIGCCAAALLLFSCSGKKDVMGPEEVVEAFARAVVSGDFEHACGLCDEAGMKDYLECCQKAFHSAEKEDSTVLSIASSILSKAEIEIEKVMKKGDGRVVSYTIKAGGNSKQKEATVKKEKGVWKVTAISDTKQDAQEKI